MNEKKWNVSTNPHVRSAVRTDKIMELVLLALLPASIFGVWHFGWNALLLIIVSVGTCVLTEYVYEKLMHKKITVSDCSAAVTGLLLALNLPSSAPWWLAVLGGIFAILIVKQLFGGLGQNFMNPALAARCFLLISFAGRMTNFAYDRIFRRHPISSYQSWRTGICAGYVPWKYRWNHR